MLTNALLLLLYFVPSDSNNYFVIVKVNININTDTCTLVILLLLFDNVYFVYIHSTESFSCIHDRIFYMTLYTIL